MDHSRDTQARGRSVLHVLAIVMLLSNPVLSRGGSPLDEVAQREDG